MRMRSLAALSLLALAVGAARAQEGPTAGPEARSLRPRLLVRDGPGRADRSLPILAARVSVEVVSGLATTTLDLTFGNDQARVLEGQLELPLPRGATITSFALEVDGRLRQASVVERERARVVFEEIERRNVDPGLVEWVAGNVFRARVFPIPQKGKKRLVLGFEQDAGTAYRLPLDLGGPLETFDVEATVHGPAPSVPAGAVPLAFARDERRGAWSGARRLAREVLPHPKELALDLPAPAEPEVLVERTRVRRPLDPEGELAFVARVPVPELPATRLAPRRITLAWDASGSASLRDVAREVAFLEAYLALVGQATVRLVVFSNEVWPVSPSTFEVREGRSPELVRRLATLRPDGATRLACLDRRELERDADQVLLFGDGLGTLGEAPSPGGELPATVVTSAARSDPGAIERFARGGPVLDLRAVEPARAAALALEEPLRLLGVDASGAREVLPAAPCRIDGPLLSLAGRVPPGQTTRLTLRFGRGARELARRTLAFDAGALPDTARVERLWALRKLEALGQDAERNGDEILSLARAHGVVGPRTSLLVLETVEDYVRYGVRPPAELEKEWSARIEARRTAEQRTREEAVAALRVRFAARVARWEKTFVPPKPRRAARVAHAGFPGAEESDHNESADGEDYGQMRGDSIGVGGGSGGMTFGGRYGGRRNLVARGGSAGGPSAPAPPVTPTIALRPFDPKTPYSLAYAQAHDPAAVYALYLHFKPDWATCAAFYLDTADALVARGHPDLALRVLSNLAELELEDAPLLRILAYRLREAGRIALAVATFERVARLRPEEPQSFRDLGLAHAQAGDWAPAARNLERAVLQGEKSRFPDVDLIALGELDEVRRRAGAAGVTLPTTLPEELLRPLEGDLRVVLTWDADATDVDLHVVEPSGEKAYYAHTETASGGTSSRDVTGGYGPEEYWIRKAPPGTFRIQANFYGSTSVRLAGDVTLQVEVVTNWGRPNEERRLVTRRLREKAETIDLFEVAFQP